MLGHFVNVVQGKQVKPITSWHQCHSRICQNKFENNARLSYRIQILVLNSFGFLLEWLLNKAREPNLLCYFIQNWWQLHAFPNVSGKWMQTDSSRIWILLDNFISLQIIIMQQDPLWELLTLYTLQVKSI